MSEEIASGNSYANKGVLPFIWNTPEGRKESYDAILTCVDFEQKHIKNSFENRMFGQKTVVTRKLVSKSECIGVYGGPRLDLTDASHAGQGTYLLQHGNMVVDGDNILSRINSIFEEKDGVPKRQAKDGYNVERAAFRAQLEDGSSIVVQAFFALKDLPEGTELRWNYGYSEAMIAKEIAKSEEAGDTSEDSDDPYYYFSDDELARQARGD
jgi:hypothetical protein